jgi:hypothetical protein
VDVIPPLAMISFDQLQPGDLFLYMTGSHKFYALKTVRPANGPAYTMVTLGPSFFEDANESILLPWDDAATVLSFGKNFWILLPTEAHAWSWNGDYRKPVCLGVAGGSFYICANGGSSAEQYNPCFVDGSREWSHVVFQARRYIPIVGRLRRSDPIIRRGPS